MEEYPVDVYCDPVNKNIVNPGRKQTRSMIPGLLTVNGCCIVGDDVDMDKTYKVSECRHGGLLDFVNNGLLRIVLLDSDIGQGKVGAFVIQLVAV